MTLFHLSLMDQTYPSLTGIVLESMTERVGWERRDKMNKNEKGRSGDCAQFFMSSMHTRDNCLGCKWHMDDKMAHCVLCFASLCANVSKRRVTSGTSRHILPVLQDLFIIAQSFSTLADDADSTTSPVCHVSERQRKFLTLNTKKKALESELVEIIKQSREERALKLLQKPPLVDNERMRNVYKANVCAAHDYQNLIGSAKILAELPKKLPRVTRPSLLLFVCFRPPHPAPLVALSSSQDAMPHHVW